MTAPYPKPGDKFKEAPREDDAVVQAGSCTHRMIVSPRSKKTPLFERV